MSEQNDKKTVAPVSKRERFFKLAGMTASVAGNYTKTRIQTLLKNDDDTRDLRAESFRESGEMIAKTLGELKGAAMKIGQMASIGSDLLPKELSDALVKLQKQAPPMDYEIIAGQIEKELGAPPASLFRSFDRKPFASASIGQVHRAVTDDGRQVVVKIQYPGVDESVDSDLAHLKLAMRASGLVHKSHKAGLNRVFDEIRRRLGEELDYCLEADNVRLFRKFHEGQDYVVIPEVIGERSSQRVLTLSYEPGDTIAEMDDAGYDQETRNQIAINMFKVMAAQLFQLKAIQADPNPANYAFRPDGRVVLYDFGCVKKLEDRVLDPYHRLVRAALDSDYETAEECLIQLGVRVPSGPPVPREFYRDWREILAQPLISNGPYDYGTSSLHQRVLKMIPETMRYASSFEPPHELVFIDRTIGGNYGNLRAIRSIVDLRPLTDYYLAEYAKTRPKS